MRSTGLTVNAQRSAGSRPQTPSGTRLVHSFDWPPRHSTPRSPSGPRRSSAISRSMPAARPRAHLSGATSGAGPAVRLSCCSVPRRASSGWRFRPTGSCWPPAMVRRAFSSGTSLPEHGFATWREFPVRSQARPSRQTVRSSPRQTEIPTSRLRTAFRSGKLPRGVGWLDCRWAKASMRSPARFLPERVFVGVRARAIQPVPPPLTRLWNLADDPTHPRLLEQFERFTDMGSRVGRRRSSHYRKPLP